MVDSKQSKQTTKITKVLQKAGFAATTKIADTLQGSIWSAKTKSTQSSNGTFVIKVTDKNLHRNAITVPINNETFSVKEDILLEQAILKYLTQQKNVPKSIIKYISFFRSNSNYFLVMENGGLSLFNFVVNAHQLITSENVQVTNWSEVVYIIFKQMIESIEFIHSKNICHFDISLENYVINDVDIEVTEYEDGTVHKLTFVTDNIQIKLVDFGLAQLFHKSDCKSSKFCGKSNYKSPEIISKTKPFDAKKNDIWSVGIALCSMVIGGALWNKASENNMVFQSVINGHLKDLFKQWKAISNCYCVDEDLMDLLQSIFQYETNRIDLKSIKTHQWIKKNK